MNSHTARARAAAQRDYFSFVHASNKRDLSEWLHDMHIRGLSANTIRQRIYLVRSSLGIDSPLNPPPRRGLPESKWLDLEQVKTLISSIPKNTRGKRDFALIATLLVTGLRLEKVRCLQWSDIYYQHRLSTVPTKFLSDIYLTAFQLADRESRFINVPPTIGCSGDQYVFSASMRYCRVDQRRLNISSKEDMNQPLSPQEINRRIARYARLAGLESEGITAECLRRTHNQLGEHATLMLVQDVLRTYAASPIRWKGIERDKRLHGIGRRSRRT